MLIVVAPAATLLLVVSIIAGTKALTIAAVLAALMTLAGSLMSTQPTQPSILTACLTTMKPMLLL